ncbi:MAG: replicative DNA helicase [Erysipelotrichaceae bacterium]|nr:replicative DNA helicase [Erysipelotrichaceae bacterium]
MPQQMPQSIDIEQALLGLLMVYPESVIKAEEQGLSIQDFFLAAHKMIYQAILDLRAENKPVELNSVSNRLSDQQKLASVGGIDYLMSLSDLAISVYNTDYYIQVLQEKNSLRKLIEACDRIRKESLEDSFDAEAILNEAEKSILSITRDRKTSAFTTSREAIDDVIKNISYLQQHRGLTGVPTGFSRLNRMTNGLQKSDLIILAARPSVGKTAFALNLVVNAAANSDRRVALFSLEMPVIQNGMRMLAIRSNVDIQKIKTGYGLENEDWAKIDHAKNELQQSNIFIDDSAGIKINEIFAKCRKLKEEQGLDLVVIDYLQLISGNAGRTFESRQVEVSEISRSLKALARELEVPVVACAQLSRDSEKENRKPTLADLRESGSIEQDADIVMLLSKPLIRKRKGKDDQLEEEQQQAAEESGRYKRLLEIAKHRNGAVGEIDFEFQSNMNIFYEIEKEREND